MRRRSAGRAVAGLLALGAVGVWAQVPAQEVHPSAPPGSSGLPGLQLVGGVQGLTAGLSAGTGVGPYVGVAALWQPLFLLGTELRYEAARLPFDDSRLPDPEALWSHSVLGLAKLGLPVTDTLRPYFGTGLGLGYLWPSHGARDLYGRDVIVELPLVLGVEVHSGRLSGGLQLSYRAVMGESFDRTDLGDASGGRVSAGLSLGIRL